MAQLADSIKAICPVHQLPGLFQAIVLHAVTKVEQLFFEILLGIVIVIAGLKAKSGVSGTQGHQLQYQFFFLLAEFDPSAPEDRRRQGCGKGVSRTYESDLIVDTGEVAVGNPGNTVSSQ